MKATRATVPAPPPDPDPSKDPAGLRISLTMPAYNEEPNIELAIAGAEAAGAAGFADYEIVVVDDGSTDATAQLVEVCAGANPRVQLVRHEKNLGYGAAVRSCLTSARYELVFLTDADNQFDLNQLGAFVEEIRQADVVVGRRVDRKDNLIRRLSGHAWNGLVWLLFRTPIHDIDCAFKLFRREALQAVELECAGAMVSTELIVKLERSGARIVQREVGHYPRTAGTSSGGDLRVILRAFKEAYRLRRRMGSRSAAEAEPSREAAER